MIVTVVFLTKDNLFHTQLEMGKEVSIGSHKKDHIQIPGFEANQIVIK